MFRFQLAIGIGLLAAGSAFGGTWAESMFDEVSRDFGSVPRGPTITHPFHLTNNTGQQVHIAGLRVSCGCTTASATRSELEPGQDTVILAQMDTHRFSGTKSVTIFVQFDQPQWDEARLVVQANARDDVTLSPDSLAFGNVRLVASAKAKLTVTFAGHSDLKIVETQCDSNYVVVNAEEVRRDVNEVAYQVTARMRPDTPVGKWFTDVWLITDNVSTPRIRVPLTIEIEPPLSVNPNLAALGEVKAGQENVRKVIVRGARPFRITAIKGTDSQITVRDNTAESKLVHILTVNLKGTTPGTLNRKIRVITDLKPNGEIDFHATAEVLP